jgi:hypothetical protein
MAGYEQPMELRSHHENPKKWYTEMLKSWIENANLSSDISNNCRKENHGINTKLNLKIAMKLNEPTTT